MRLAGFLLLMWILIPNSNAQNIDNVNGDGSHLTDIDFSVLDPNEIEQTQYIFSGEYHRNKASQQVVWQFLQHLNKHHDVNHFGLELSYAAGLSINNFLSSGDTLFLKKILTEYTWPAVFPTKEYYDFFISLREYNLSVDEDQRILVFGFDIDYHIACSINYLDTLLTKETHLGVEFSSTMKDFISKLNQNINHLDAVEKDIKRFLLEHYPINNIAIDSAFRYDSKMILENILQACETNAHYENGEWSAYKRKGIHRDRHMEINLNKLADTKLNISRNKIYIHAGLFHVEGKNSVLKFLHLDQYVLLRFGYVNCQILGKTERIDIDHYKMNSSLLDNEINFKIYPLTKSKRSIKTVPGLYEIIIRNQGASSLIE